MKALLVLSAGGVMVGCGRVLDDVRGPIGYATATPFRVLPSPRPPTTPDPFLVVTGDPELDRFLAFSVLLTGFDELQPELARVYLDSLNARPDPGSTLDDLYEQAGYTEESAPQSLEELEAAGIFDEEDSRELADKIIEYWYTGVYEVYENGEENDENANDDQNNNGNENDSDNDDEEESGSEEQVATYVDALMWKSMTFTKPPTICMWPWSWAAAPEFLR